MAVQTKHHLIIWSSIASVLSLLMIAGFLHGWQDRLIDTLFVRHPASNTIVIVDIDEASIRSVGQWPWPRAIFGNVVNHLQSAQVIGIDVNFKEPSRTGSGDDMAFATALSQSKPPVILTADLQPDDTISVPLPELAVHSQYGFPNIIIAGDGIARTIRYTKGDHQSFALKISEEYYHYLHSTTLPNVPINQTRIVYAGPDRSYQHIAAVDVIAGNINPEVFHNKIVLIGATARDLQDYHLTPFNLTSGVEIQGNIIETLLGQKFFTHSTLVDIVLIFLLAAITLILVVSIQRIAYALLAVLGLIALYNTLAFLSFDQFFILNLLYPNIAIVATVASVITYQYRSTAAEKKFIQDSFSRYLSPHVIHELLHDPSKLALGGKKANLTILFSDIRNFTTMSEGMTPEDLTSFLNDYLTRMTNLVLEREGVIDKYIGDAIMSFWGAPLKNDNHPLDGVLTALDMMDALKEFNVHNEEVGNPIIDIGIGLNSGDVTVGNMGSEKRFDYTVMGDNVNLASRLEGLTKTYGINILISEATSKLLPQHPDIMLRELDQVQVKGKKQAVRIYQVVARAKQTSVQSILEQFTQARQYYYDGNWQQAIEIFNAIIEKTQDKPSQLLRERCQEFMQHTPDNWNGVYTLTHK